MKTLVFGFLSLVALAVSAAPVVDPASVTMSQDRSTRNVVVSYVLGHEPAIITVDFEQRNDQGVWVSLGEKVRSVVGDVNRKVEPGNRTLTWAARKDWPDQQIHDESVRAVVTAWSLSCPPPYMVLDLNTNVQLFYPSETMLPYGISNVIYRTSMLVMRKIPAAGVTWIMGQPATTDIEKTLASWSDPADETPHWVSFSKDYYMAIYPMTQGQNKQLTGGSNSREEHDEKPVDGMSYVTLRGKPADGIDWPTTGDEVGGVLATIRQKTGLNFDIPTEAEWEFACRAGSQSAFYTGDGATSSSTPNCGFAQLEDYAWFNYQGATRVGGAYKDGLQIVGRKKPNAWGLYDMMGNVTEWCKDWAGPYDLSVQPALDPQGPVTGEKRIKRGGHWGSNGAYCRSSARRSTQYLDYGFDKSSGGDFWSNGYRLVCPAVVK